MHPAVQTRVESRRGCGFRKPGGTYLCSDGVMAACGRLPIPLTVCPTCHAGIKPARGWTWIDADAIAAQKSCTTKDTHPSYCHACPLNGKLGMAGLLWIGEKFYPRPEDFLKEAATMGVSRRLSQVPKGFEVGKTWVIVAHRKSNDTKCPDCRYKNDPYCACCDGVGFLYTPAVFHAFKPQRIEYVVKGDETDEEIERLLKRGITPVHVEQQGTQRELQLQDDEED